MTLRDSVFQLTSAHLRTAPDGKAHKVPALLDLITTTQEEA